MYNYFLKKERNFKVQTSTKCKLVTFYVTFMCNIILITTNMLQTTVFPFMHLGNI